MTNVEIQCKWHLVPPVLKGCMRYFLTKVPNLNC